MDEKEQPHYIGHRQRIKQKYILNGLNSWMDYEVLELALSYAIPRKDTKLPAKNLIEKFKNFNGVLDADIKELSAVAEIGEHAALFLKLLGDIARLYFQKDLYDKDLISSPSAVVNYLKTLLKGSHNEEFYVLFLNTSNHLITIENIQTGTVNKTAVYPRKIVELALYNHSTGIILAHNHPGGTLKPSEDDCKTTELIKNALEIVDIALLDHIIIGGNNYFSFKEQGML